MGCVRSVLDAASVFAGEHDSEDAGGHRWISRIWRMNSHRAIVVVDLEQDAFALSFKDRAIMLAVGIVFGIKGGEATHLFKDALTLGKRDGFDALGNHDGSPDESCTQ